MLVGSKSSITQANRTYILNDSISGCRSLTLKLLNVAKPVDWVRR